MPKTTIVIQDDLHERLWEYVRNTSQGSSYGRFTKVVTQALEEFLERHRDDVSEVRRPEQ